MIGHFAVFDQWAEIDSDYEGRFMEQIAPGSFARTFAEDHPVPLVQHGGDPSVGSKPLGTVDVLREDDVGAYFEVALVDAPYVRDVLPGLRAGLYGSSFKFRVRDEMWRARRRDRPRTRRASRNALSATQRYSSSGLSRSRHMQARQPARAQVGGRRPAGGSGCCSGDGDSQRAAVAAPKHPLTCDFGVSPGGRCTTCGFP